MQVEVEINYRSHKLVQFACFSIFAQMDRNILDRVLKIFEWARMWAVGYRYLQRIRIIGIRTVPNLKVIISYCSYIFIEVCLLFIAYFHYASRVWRGICVITMQFEEQRCTIIWQYVGLIGNIQATHHIPYGGIVSRVNEDILRQLSRLLLNHFIDNFCYQQPTLDAHHIWCFCEQFKCSRFQWSQFLRENWIGPFG